MGPPSWPQIPYLAFSSATHIPSELPWALTKFCRHSPLWDFCVRWCSLSLDAPPPPHPSLLDSSQRLSQGLAWRPLPLWWQLAISPNGFLSTPESLESSFRKFRGLLLFLELDVYLNIHNQKNFGGFDWDNGVTIFNEGLFYLIFYYHSNEKIVAMTNRVIKNRTIRWGKVFPMQTVGFWFLAPLPSGPPALSARLLGSDSFGELVSNC